MSLNLFPARESLVSDIPVGDGKTANLLYNVSIQTWIINYLPAYRAVSAGNSDDGPIALA
jgi:hypothetical protein